MTRKDLVRESCNLGTKQYTHKIYVQGNDNRALTHQIALDEEIEDTS